MGSAKAFLKFLGSITVRVVIAVLAGALLLTAVCALPTGPIDAHVAASGTVMDREGDYPVLFSWCTSQLDNYTDSIILLTSADDSCGSALEQALSCSRGTFGDTTPHTDLVEHYVNGREFSGHEPYYRYWHGYQLLTRPLLLLTGYQGLRLLNGIVQTGLLVLLLWLMVKRGLKAYIAPYLLCLLFLNPAALVLSLQFSSSYYAMTLGSIAVVYFADRLDELDWRIFLWIGVATAFFDLLTYPIVTVGIPAVLYFCLRQRDDIPGTFCRGVRICFSWGFGYGLMWAGKWILGSALLGGEVLTSATAAIAERTSGNMDASAGLLGNLIFSVATNLKFFLTTPATLLLAVMVAVLLVLVVLSARKHGLRIATVGRVFFPFLILAALPAVWYMAAAQHSSIHYWFTNKGFAVSVLAGTCALIRLRSRLEAQT